LLGLAERPDTLGAYPVDVIRPALVQAFLDGLADRPAQQKNAQTALKAVEKWALVRDLLAHPITMGTEAPGGTGAYEPWTDEQVELAEGLPATPGARHHPGIEHRAGRRRPGEDALVRHRGIRGPSRHQRHAKENRARDVDPVHAGADQGNCRLGTPTDLHPPQRGRLAVHSSAALRPMAA